MLSLSPDALRDAVALCDAMATPRAASDSPRSPSAHQNTQVARLQMLQNLGPKASYRLARGSVAMSLPMAKFNGGRPPLKGGSVGGWKA